MNHDEAEVEKSAIIIIEDVLPHFQFIIMKKFFYKWNIFFDLVQGNV